MRAPFPTKSGIATLQSGPSDANTEKSLIVLSKH